MDWLFYYSIPMFFINNYSTLMLVERQVPKADSQCRGQTCSLAIEICCQKGCFTHSMMCDNLMCDCRLAHIGHEMRRLSCLKERFTSKQADLKAYLETCEAVDMLVDLGVESFEDLNEEYNLDTEGRLLSLRENEERQWKLLTGSCIYETISGDAVRILLTKLDEISPSVRQIGKLTTLYLTRSTCITSDQVKVFARGFSQLTMLDIGQDWTQQGFKRITDEGLRHLVQGLPRLTMLDVRVNRLTDEGAKIVARALPNLVKLWISGNYITAEGAAYISHCLTHLIHLNITANRFAQRTRNFMHMMLPRTAAI